MNISGKLVLKCDSGAAQLYLSSTDRGVRRLLCPAASRSLKCLLGSRSASGGARSRGLYLACSVEEDPSELAVADEQHADVSFWCL